MGSKTDIGSEKVNRCIKNNIIKYMDTWKCIILCIMHMDRRMLFSLPASKLYYNKHVDSKIVVIQFSFKISM